MNPISSGYNDYKRYQNTPLSDDKSLLAVAAANQQAAVKVDQILSDDTQEQVSVSEETQKKLANLNLAKLLGKQVPSAETSEQSDKVTKYKALFETEGGIGSYLSSISSEALATSLLEHPLAPNLV